MKKRYNITLNVEVDVDLADDGKRIPWIKFIGWKHGIITKNNRFIETEAMVKMTEQNMQYLGEEIFKTAKEMFYEDEDLKINS